MKLKGLLLLILFILNYSEAMLAESEEFFISESYGKCLESADFESCVNNDHCPDLDCCHKNHFHHYLPLSSDVRFLLQSESYTSPPTPFIWSSINKKISKPPVELV